MSLRALVAAVALLWAAEASAQDRLVPRDDGVLADYRATLDSVLEAAFQPGVRLRAVVEPAFEPEFAAGLIDEGGTFSIFVVRLERQLWPLRRSSPAAPPPTQCKVGVDASLAADLTEVWRQALQEVRPGDGLPPGLDGVFYRFSMPTDAGELAGMTWSPPDHTRPGQLARAVHAMRDYCGTRDDHHLEALAQAVAALKG